MRSRQRQKALFEFGLEFFVVVVVVACFGIQMMLALVGLRERQP